MTFLDGMAALIKLGLDEHVRLYHGEQPRLCARPGCPQLVTGPRRLYCSDACRQQMWYKRHKSSAQAGES